MKPIHYIIILLLALNIGCKQSNDTSTIEEVPIETELKEEQIITETESAYDQALATEYGADEYGMKMYVIAFLKRGSNRDRTKEEAAELQAAHMANIGRLAEEGKLILAGPFGGDGDLRGLYVFDVKTIEEARALTATDPAIQAGSLEMELIEWYGSAGVMAIPELHEKVAKTLM